MLTEEQRFLFDLQGYIVLENVLSATEVQRMVADMEAHGIDDPENDPTLSRFVGFLEWGEHWRNLIDHPQLLPLMREILGPKFRLDHVYGMAMRASGNAGHFGMHHHSGLFDHGCYYVSHGQRMHNGLIVVSYALTDIAPDVGGFCCIPGSHKALYPTPKQWYGLDDNPLVRQVPQKAGDVLIFTEALTHGTMPWTSPTGERRSILLKYCPLYMQWVQQTLNANIAGLTERQRLILSGPYVGGRPAIDYDS